MATAAELEVTAVAVRGVQAWFSRTHMEHHRCFDAGGWERYLSFSSSSWGTTRVGELVAALKKAVPCTDASRETEAEEEKS